MLVIKMLVSYISVSKLKIIATLSVAIGSLSRCCMFVRIYLNLSLRIFSRSRVLALLIESIMVFTIINEC